MMTSWGDGLFQKLQEFEAVAGFSHHLSIADTLNNSSNPPAKHGVIIGQKNAERRSHGLPP